MGGDDDGGQAGVLAGITAVDIAQLILGHIAQTQLLELSLDKVGPHSFGKGGGGNLLDLDGEVNGRVLLAVEPLQRLLNRGLACQMLNNRHEKSGEGFLIADFGFSIGAYGLQLLLQRPNEQNSHQPNDKAKVEQEITAR